MKRAIYLDCFSGVSGDMFVGALCDLGAPLELIRKQIDLLGFDQVELSIGKEQRAGITGSRFLVAHHEDHAHRTYAGIRDMLQGSELSPFVKQRSLGVFHRIAVAEGAIHDVPVDRVHFHEVGAIDSIVDIVAGCVAVEALDTPAIFASTLQDGTGLVECAHGRIPIPAPATLEILRGIPLAQTDEPVELITPTGAALVAEFCKSYGPMPLMTIEKTGYGVGGRENPGRPNLLRAVLGTPASVPTTTADRIACIETNLDDLSPEIVGAVMDRLLQAGALDVFITPIQMKKNRPGTMLSVLCVPSDVPSLAELLLRETTAFGLRVSEHQRLKLDRRTVQVETRFGTIDVKLGLREKEIIQISPEYDSCLKASDRAGQPLRAVYEEAIRACRENPPASANTSS